MSKFALRALICCLVFAAFTIPSAPAQVQEPAENKGAAAAYGALLCLRSTATVLHTTAHPDDEDGALLTWLSRQAPKSCWPRGVTTACTRCLRA